MLCRREEEGKLTGGEPETVETWMSLNEPQFFSELRYSNNKGVGKTGLQLWSHYNVGGEVYG